MVMFFSLINSEGLGEVKRRVNEKRSRKGWSAARDRITRSLCGQRLNLSHNSSLVGRTCILNELFVIYPLLYNPFSREYGNTPSLTFQDFSFFYSTFYFLFSTFSSRA